MKTNERTIISEIKYFLVTVRKSKQSEKIRNEKMFFKNLNFELFTHSKESSRKSSWKMYWISYVVKVAILLDNIPVSVSNFSFNAMANILTGDR